MKAQAQLEFPLFKGEAITQLPEDLFIPPDALEIYLEDYFENMLKKLRDLNYDQNQIMKRKDLTF